MGRYYRGHISGKFWFGIQSSKDADFFGQLHKDVYHFYVCGCTAYDLVTNCTSIYCTSCYPSCSAHLLAMRAEGFAGENTWIPDGKIQYVFSKTDIQGIVEKIELLESYVGEHMDSFRIRDKGDSIQYKFTMPGGIRGDEISLVARLCLGKQILYCLEKHGLCEFVADL